MSGQNHTCIYCQTVQQIRVDVIFLQKVLVLSGKKGHPYIVIPKLSLHITEKKTIETKLLEGCELN